MTPLSPPVCSLHPPLQHRSAPGSPQNSSHRIHRHLRQQQRAPSAEERGGALLHVPFSSMRGKSLPEDMQENTLQRDSLYLLKQFDIQGRKVNYAHALEMRIGNVQVVHLGDSYRHRSTNSLASCPSHGFILQYPFFVCVSYICILVNNQLNAY